MTTDGPHPVFIEEEGFVDGLVRKAVELGVPAMQAIQMVTINPANPDLYRYLHTSTTESVPVAYFRSTVITKREDIPFPSVNGYADLSNHQDLIHAALIDRDGKWDKGNFTAFCPPAGWNGFNIQYNNGIACSGEIS